MHVHAECSRVYCCIHVYIHVRAKARQILGEYSQIRFLSGLWYKFRCMRTSIHEPLYIPVTFELSACTESSVRYVKRSFSRVHSFRRKWLAATRVGNSISPYLDTRKTFVEEARERRPIRVDPIPSPSSNRILIGPRG